MAAFRVVVTDQVFPDVELERSMIEQAGGELVVATGDRDRVLATAREADALLNTYLPLDRAALAALPRCKVVARYGIGVDNIDLAAARQAGIAVTNVPDYCVEEVASHTVALILALVRRLPQGEAVVRSGGWGVPGLGVVRRLSTLTVGLLGYGRIGSRVAAVLATIGARVVVADPYLRAEQLSYPLVDIGELFATADVLSLHCPLTEATRHLVNADRLAAMRPGSYLVNTSRGPLVVLDDLYDALVDGRLAGAALDVFEPEPPRRDRWDQVPNLLVTPHAAFYSVEAVAESQRKATTQVLKALRGEPLDYPVN